MARQMRLSFSLRVAVLAAMLASTACTHLYGNKEEESEADEDAIVVFENQSLDQATVFIVPQGLNAQRIGTVMAGRTDTLVVPREFRNKGTVNIVARLLARSRAPSSGPVSIRSGDALEVRLGVDDRILTVLPARP